MPIGGGAGGGGQPTGPAGGDLAGTYPNPTVGAAKITTAKLAAAVTLDAIATANATAANISMNSHKLTGLTVASAATDAASLANTLDQFGAPAAAVAFNSQKITGLANGSASTDGAAFGQLATASGGVSWTPVTKPSDTSRASTTTLAADPDLVFTAVSGGCYEFQFFIVYASPSGAGTPDLKAAFGEDATATRGVCGALIAINSSNAPISTGGFLAATDQTTAGAFGTRTTNQCAMFTGWHVGNGGTFSILWSQNTSDPGATILRAGSVLRYRRIV